MLRLYFLSDNSVFFYHDEIKSTIETHLDDLAAHLISEINLTNYSYKKVSFDGPSNFGGTHAWIAIYPNLKADHKSSYQYYLGIHPNELVAGLKPGSEVDDEESENLTDGLKTLEDVINVFKSLKDKEKELNDLLVNYWKYAPGDNATRWQEFYTDGIMAIGWDDLGDLSNLSVEDIAKALGVKNPYQSNDVSCCDNFRSANIGDIVIANKGRKNAVGIGIITGPYEWKQERKSYKHVRTVNWIINKPVAFDKTIFRVETFATTKKWNTIYNKYIEKYPALENILDNLESIVNHESTDVPTILPTSDNSSKFKNPNIILYGPPGTGKTYNSVELAFEIINGRIANNHEEAQAYFKKELHNHIEFITFHQNMSYEDFVQGIKPKLDEEELNFEKKDGLFKVISDRARQEDNFEEVYKKLKEDIQQAPSSITLKTKSDKKEFDLARININGNIVVKPHTEKATEMVMKKEIIKEYIASGKIIDWKSYIVPIAEFLDVKYKVSKHSNLQETYILIIDEINRANISRVFGELITLIEEDKRLGQKHEIKAVLPSGDEFTVPPNLYIIGTMNTADKSIALVDIALRRRFEFRRMDPVYFIQDETIHYSDNLKKMNKYIRDNKGIDFQIGHSYFMGKDFNLDYTMTFKIIPLLYEYFMNDESSVFEVLKAGGFNCKNNPDTGIIEFININSKEEVQTSEE